MLNRLICRVRGHRPWVDLGLGPTPRWPYTRLHACPRCRVLAQLARDGWSWVPISRADAIEWGYL